MEMLVKIFTVDISINRFIFVHLRNEDGRPVSSLLRVFAFIVTSTVSSFFYFLILFPAKVPGQK